jgi:capsular polysaccharide biosynthesis protein
MASAHAITQPAITSLGLPYTPAQLASEITASTPFNSKTIKIAVTDTQPQRAADIAATVSRELARAASRYALEAGQKQPVLTVSRAAAVPTAPQPVAWVFPLIAGLLAGFAAGLAIAVVRHGVKPAGAALHQRNRHQA